MSVFHLTTAEVKDRLEELPHRHTKAEILALVEALQADLRQDKEADGDFAKKVQRHAGKHAELFFSYPMLYRTAVKGTFRPVVLDIIMDAREAIEAGRQTKKEALDVVIRRSVDEVNAYRRHEREGPSTVDVDVHGVEIKHDAPC
jgi:hypothetical protein